MPEIEKTADHNLKAALDKLHEDVHSADMAPFWAVDTTADHDEDRQVMDKKKAIPFVWKYDRDIEPLLQRSAELITTESSERRSLILVNPGLAPRRASVSTMYTAYRLNDPREIMPPHRHSPNAIRLGLTGTQNFTGVEGENITFGPGDMVLTPHDTWHNHGNQGDEPAVNLSVLDVPLVETLNATYFEHDYTEVEEGERVRKAVQSERFPSDYSQRVYGSGGLMPRFVSHHRGTGNAAPMYVYRWEMMRELLEKFRDWDGDPYEALLVEYVDPTNGKPVFKTITFFMQMLRPGERTRPLKQNASLLCAPFEGRGHSLIDGKKLDWGVFDTLAVPGGSWCEHVNESDSEPAILFVASDEPTLKALSLYQKHGRLESGEVVRLV
ncbi:cupin domain-containing protein [Pelagibius litoralis]|uniref:Cupin domain-containing protein n=1 Tax=Pelagibius litoralis TaxID=374515 RepID=A0A967EYH0_9PROT|nr:cupin domain-containing protein [Pelagibius litoralis]NIA69756.1 cupin domain-containing protein [Pelagibius litoralis]